MDWEPTACDLANYSADFLASYSAILGELFRNFDSVENLLTRTGSIFPRLHEGGNGPKCREITCQRHAKQIAKSHRFSAGWFCRSPVFMSKRLATMTGPRIRGPE